MQQEKNSIVQMSSAVRAWMVDLNAYPGWRKWQRERTGSTLYFDDILPWNSSDEDREFTFSSEIEKQHKLIMQYLYLLETSNSLKECEYYFRRYPFTGLPVSKSSHVTNVCEMYFNRFYEFKERLKRYFDAFKAVVPDHKLNISAFITLYGTEFDQELKERNGVHHRRRFEDLAIDKIFLTGILADGPTNYGWDKEHLIAYRKCTREWAERVRVRSAKLDEFIEAVASITLSNCKFLETVSRS